MDSNILLESGTNELEVLEFIINGNHYGINVEKVREILPYQEITRFQIHTHVLKESSCHVGISLQLLICSRRLDSRIRTSRITFDCDEL